MGRLVKVSKSWVNPNTIRWIMPENNSNTGDKWQASIAFSHTTERLYVAKDFKDFNDCLKYCDKLAEDINSQIIYQIK